MKTKNIKRICNFCRKDYMSSNERNIFYCSLKCYFAYKRVNTNNRIELSKKDRFNFLLKYNFCCFWCKKQHTDLNPLQIHHLDDNPNNTIYDNLVPLCVSCHRKTQRRYKNHIADEVKKLYFVKKLSIQL